GPALAGDEENRGGMGGWRPCSHSATVFFVTRKRRARLSWDRPSWARKSLILRRQSSVTENPLTSYTFIVYTARVYCSAARPSVKLFFRVFPAPPPPRLAAPARKESP